MKNLLVALSLLTVLQFASAAELSDVEARRYAIDMEATIKATRPQLNELISKGDKQPYHRLMGSLLSKLNSWPERNLSNKAIFPYWVCQNAALSMVSYGDAWNRGDASIVWRDHVLADFKRQLTECQGAIAKPDMSLKNIL